MIIYGSKGRTTTVGRGIFFCPKCQRQTNYKHERAGKYFTLYFIPIIKTKDLGDFIECQSCYLTFKPEVLHMSAQFERDIQSEQRVARVIADLRKQLDSGVPIQALAQGLSEAGMPEDVLKQIIFAATNGKLSECSQCGLTFAAGIRYCSICGKQISITHDFSH